jgi:hypothetical protein
VTVILTASDGMDFDIHTIPHGQASGPACGAPASRPGKIKKSLRLSVRYREALGGSPIDHFMAEQGHNQVSIRILNSWDNC